MAPRFRARVGAALAAALLAGACFDPPVRETLTLAFRPDGSLRVELALELDSAREWGRWRDNERVQRRLEAKAAALAAGSDPWLQRFEALGCEREGSSWERAGGELLGFRRWALCADPAAAATLLADRLVTFELQRDGRVVELRLIPLGGGPAGRAERRQADAALAAWSAAFARYVEAALAVARRGGELPDRGRALWLAVFDEPPEPSGMPPAAADAALAAALQEAMAAVLAAWVPAAGEEESLVELAQRVFDPLPGRFVVELPVRADEVEGFAPAGERTWAAPAGGLDAALAALEGRWLAPDPVRRLLEHERQGGQSPLQVAPFLAGALRDAAPPTAAEVRAAVLTALERTGELRLVWRAPLPRPPGAGR